MQKINFLKEEIINQIAAGEVIEKPSCLVRELLDNSLDARADHISIYINLNPLFIRIEDNGIGIPEAEIELAFKRHTTSKINSLTDLYEIKNPNQFSRGFRGEALAAIASVAEVTIFTKTATNEVGTKVSFKNGQVIQKDKKPRTNGTTIEIKNLFYNAPVRKKFISTFDEKGMETIKPIHKKYLRKEIIHHILTSNGVSFNYTFRSGEREEEKFIPQESTFLDKIEMFFKAAGRKNLKKELLPIEGERNGFLIQGYISNSRIREKTAGSLYLILFNRVVKDYSFIKAVTQAYGNIIPFRAYPIVFLKVTPPKRSVDINVHPQKKEVRFLVQENFFSAVYYLIKENLARSLIDMQREDLSKSATFFYQNPTKEGSKVAFNDYNDYPPATHNYLNSSNQKANQESFWFETGFKVLGQMAKCYILFSIGNDLYITDQHAAHERINFDKIKAHLNDNSKAAQSLLIPLIIEKSSLEKDTILAHQEILNSFQINLESFGENGLRINTYPSFIPEKNLLEVLGSIFEAIADKKSFTKSEVMKDISARIACHISVRAGDELSIQEMEALIKEIYQKNYIHTCPHGRPFVKKISENDFAAFFERNKHIIG